MPKYRPTLIRLKRWETTSVLGSSSKDRKRERRLREQYRASVLHRPVLFQLDNKRRRTTHRRALRLVRGLNFEANICMFLMYKLKLPTAFLVEMGNVDVKRIFDARSGALEAGAAPAPTDEVIVTFSSKECRDKVKAAGYNLASHTEAGMRIHVPGFLVDSFNVLQSLGYHLKQKDGQIQRSIKFDDQNYNLVMDIRTDGVWKRVTEAQAKEIAKDNRTLGLAQHYSRLTTSKKCSERSETTMTKKARKIVGIFIGISVSLVKIY